MRNLARLGQMNMLSRWTTGPLLGPDFPLPLDRPFTTRQAVDAHVNRNVLTVLVREGYLRRLVKGVLVAAQCPEDLVLRTRALRLLVPENAVVVDWTAVWLYTGMLLPGQHLEQPPVHLFMKAGHHRLRNDLCVSGERTFAPGDLRVIGGLTVTTQLRTALDIGRLAPRDMAIGALDALMRTESFERGELLEGVARFRGQRGVVQLRDLAPRADPRAESMGESVLRLRWEDVPSLPPPEPQIPILGDDGRPMYWLDLGVEELRFAAEYDGEEHHSSDEDREHDRRRRKWIADNRSWAIEPVRKENVFGPTRDVEGILYNGIADARRRLGKPFG